MKLGQNVCLDEISGQIRNLVMWDQKLGHTVEKPCLQSQGHIFSPILIKLGQNVCLNEISNVCEIGSCGVKN